MSSTADLQLSVRRRGDETQMWIDGEVDFVHAHELVTTGLAALDDGARVLVLECGGIEFINSAGLGALVQLHGAARDRGRVLEVRHPSPLLRRLLVLTRLDGVFAVDDPG